MLKKWGNLGKDWDSSSIDTVTNVSTKPDKVQDLIDLITDNEGVHDIVQAIHIQDTFPFTYDVREEAGVEGDYPNIHSQVLQQDEAASATRKPERDIRVCLTTFGCCAELTHLSLATELRSGKRRPYTQGKCKSSTNFGDGKLRERLPCHQPGLLLAQPTWCLPSAGIISQQKGGPVSRGQA
ncbi:hypothetical protein MMC31_005742 [Peltigera leucophlebia]|nr:hypothetical protein [Peltigera leucophlebia]